MSNCLVDLVAGGFCPKVLPNVGGTVVIYERMTRPDRVTEVITDSLGENPAPDVSKAIVGPILSHKKKIHDRREFKFKGNIHSAHRKITSKWDNLVKMSNRQRLSRTVNLSNR